MLLSRQYYQMVDPEQLTLPAPRFLRLPEVQRQIYKNMFDDRMQWPPPERYKFRVLKRLVEAMEKAIEDPEEDEISDDLSNRLTQHMARPFPTASDAAQQKSYVTYSAPSRDALASQITVLEARSLLASSGTTGFRTWEAALHLGAFLFSENGREYVNDKTILELGAGTGFLSIFCAKHLGATHVLATDGSVKVVNDIKVNASLNLVDDHQRFETAILQWGHTLIGGVTDRRDRGGHCDLILGADVTYDVNSMPALIATIRDLFELYPQVTILISATVRNQDTLAVFLGACDMNGFDVEHLDFPVPKREDQIGFFIPTSTTIKIFLITNSRGSTDAFAL
ncbi:MAG: hypothetical protein Q9164_001353 [Protoblastenia rupestris]